jgi:N-acetylmuramoyl-L-alanine amidase
MTRRNAALVLAFGLIAGVLSGPVLFRDSAGAAPRIPHTEQLFAIAANHVVHDHDPAYMAELRCLALNIYWEARSESIPGQLAVAAVTLNRVQSPRFPSSVCDVVRQGGEVRRHRCQFSWWCDGRSDKPRDRAAWKESLHIAKLIKKGEVNDPTNGALWYHAVSVKPVWAKKLDRYARIGQHIFYTDPKRAPKQVADASLAN